MFEQIFPAHWLALSHDMREHLAKTFKVNRSASTEIMNNTIISDGRSVNDLKVITKEALQEYINDEKEESFSRLWELALSKAQGEIMPMKELPVVEVKKEEVIAPVVDEKKINPFRQLTKKEAEVHTILTKNANDKKSKQK